MAYSKSLTHHILAVSNNKLINSMTNIKSIVMNNLFVSTLLELAFIVYANDALDY